MKKIFSYMLFFYFLIPSLSFGSYLTQESLKILTQQEITALTHHQLIETYVDVLTELEAIKTFHTTSGFKPQEYKQYKDVIRFRYNLLFEIYRRKIDIPESVR